MSLVAEELGFSYRTGIPVLQEVSFEIAANQVVYVLGHNGCGKSTLFNCLSGVYAPTAGRVLIDSVDIIKMRPGRRARHIGLVPQGHSAAFPYTAREMILMGRTPHLGLFQTPSKADSEVADEALEAVGLGGLADRRFNELSGGERRLVAVARGLAQQPAILLLDEPDAYLDPRNQHIVQETIVRLAREGRTFVITSHSPNSALMYADRVMVMKKGKLLADGRPGATLTEALLSEAYDMPVTVVSEWHQGQHRPRAVIPRRTLQTPDGI